ncbi:MAG: hypothetical protein KBD25_01705 [Rickettsiaceae bacterium]|nr:hypothetical protein [Rickettsiaceae bacterium]BBB57027.1 transporter AmpG 3 [Candidatus Megaera polyxenophila]
MKALRILVILSIIFIALVVLAIYGLRAGKLNTPINYALQYYFQLKKIDPQIGYLALEANQARIDSIVISRNGIEFTLNNIVINYNFDLNYKESRFSAVVQIDKIKASTPDNQQLATGRIDIAYESFFIKNESKVLLDIDDIFYKQAPNNADKPIELQNGKAQIEYSFADKQSKYDIKVNFKDGVTFDLHGKLSNNITFTGNVKNLPLTIYKPIYYLYQKDDLLIFLNEFIKEGILESGEFSVNVSEEDIKNNNYNGENIKGFVKVRDLKFVYNNELPPLTNMQIDVLQKGMVTEFIINKANSTDIEITNGLIHMVWQGQEHTKLLITAKAQGPTSALTDFITVNIHKLLKQASIDLRKFSGKADIDIKIEIPIKPGTKDTYDITAKIPNTGLSIFNNKITLNKGNIFGKYSGDRLKITGEGKINGFDSEIEFTQNFEDQTEFHHKLNIITALQFSKSSKKPQKVGFIKLLGGNSKLNFEYININDEGRITVNSDLKNLDLYFDKLGIHKKQGEKSNFILNGILENPIKGKINFKVAGDNNLNISGLIDIDETTTKMILDKINHRQTELSSSILINKDNFDIIIKGKTLDLSRADMFQFLEKERDAGTTKMHLAVDKVKLKNDILLNDLKLNFKCTYIKCYEGQIDAKIGSKKVEMNLTQESNSEKWLVKSDNAGALLKGIGAYEDMRAGSMLLVLTASRKEITAGEVIPIVDGKFEFERFVLYNAPSLTKLVSVVSVPGFVNMISGNKDIIFSNMKGKFNFQKGVLHIFHSQAVGPFFSFTMQGDIDTTKRVTDLSGQVTPSLYGLSALVGYVPVIGKIFTGDKKHGGIISAPYRIKDSY